MGKIRDITNQKFGYWTALNFSHYVLKTRGKRHFWNCRCICGAVKAIDKQSLTFGNSRSCGCMKNAQIGEKNRKHGMTETKLFSIWTNMQTRCYNPKNINFKNYGGRGIKICKRWHNFENFFEDMGQPPENMTLDRIDNNGDYSPNNCRWATKLQQARNCRKVRKITHREQTFCLSEWEEITGINQRTIKDRLNTGWSIEDTLQTPIGGKRNHSTS